MHRLLHLKQKDFKGFLSHVKKFILKNVSSFQLESDSSFQPKAWKVFLNKKVFYLGIEPVKTVFVLNENVWKESLKTYRLLYCLVFS